MAREREKGGKVRGARENAHSQCMGGEMMSQLEVKGTEQRSQCPYVCNGARTLLSEGIGRELSLFFSVHLMGGEKRKSIAQSSNREPEAFGGGGVIPLNIRCGSTTGRTTFFLSFFFFFFFPPLLNSR